MKKITVNSSRKYDVIIETGSLAQCGQYSLAVKSPCTVVIVSDDKVSDLYGKTVEQSYLAAGYQVLNFTFPNGEKSKNTQTLIQLLEFLASNKITRTDLLVALGGGVVGDLAGFAAAIYLRGIEFIQIPTTFLAAIDSSVGGKTGIDLTAGKNLAGAFHQPILVICDPMVFATLEVAVFNDGVSEAIKYGVIRDKNLFEILLNQDIHENIEEIIEKCVTIKKDIVERDELDLGERQLLNFGHTAGHAIESLSNFQISHGHGVAMGMVIIAKAAESQGLVKEKSSPSIIKALDKYGISYKTDFTPEAIATKAGNDKKRTGTTITLILPSKIGEAYLQKFEISQLADFFRLGLE